MNGNHQPVRNGVLRHNKLIGCGEVDICPVSGSYENTFRVVASGCSDSIDKSLIKCVGKGVSVRFAELNKVSAFVKLLAAEIFVISFKNDIVRTVFKIFCDLSSKVCKNLFAVFK